MSKYKSWAKGRLIDERRGQNQINFYGPIDPDVSDDPTPPAHPWGARSSQGATIASGPKDGTPEFRRPRPEPASAPAGG